MFDTLRPRQNGRQFPIIFKHTFFKLYIITFLVTYIYIYIKLLIQISLKYVPKGSINSLLTYIRYSASMSYTVLFEHVKRAWFLYVSWKYIPQFCARDLETKFSYIETGIGYIQFAIWKVFTESQACCYYQYDFVFEFVLYFSMYCWVSCVRCTYHISQGHIHGENPYWQDCNRRNSLLWYMPCEKIEMWIYAPDLVKLWITRTVIFATASFIIMQRR